MGRISKKTAALAAIGALAVPVGWAIAPASAQPAPAAQNDTGQNDTDTSNDGAAPAAGVTTTEAGDTGTSTDDPATRRAERRAARRAERQKLVAEKLGVTPEQLRDARLGVLEDKLAERVASGRITQERADEILQAAKDGTLPQLRRRLREERNAGG